MFGGRAVDQRAKTLDPTDHVTGVAQFARAPQDTCPMLVARRYSARRQADALARITQAGGYSAAAWTVRRRSCRCADLSRKAKGRTHSVRCLVWVSE